MHCELEGSCKNELAAMLFYFLRKRPTWGFTLEKLKTLESERTRGRLVSPHLHSQLAT